MRGSWLILIRRQAEDRSLSLEGQLQPPARCWSHYKPPRYSPGFCWSHFCNMTTFLCNLYLQIWELTQHKNTNLRSVMVRKYKCNFCMANIRLHKKLCKKGNKSTLCLPVCLVAAIKITGAECFCQILSPASSHRWPPNIRKLKIFGPNEKYNSL